MTQLNRASAGAPKRKVKAGAKAPAGAKTTTRPKPKPKAKPAWDVRSRHACHIPTDVLMRFVSSLHSNPALLFRKELID